MVPKKDANDLLCRMFKAQFVKMQEVPRSADHNAQRTFFLWFVDLPKVRAPIPEDISRDTALCVSIRVCVCVCVC